MSYKESIVQYLSSIINVIHPFFPNITIVSNFSNKEIETKNILPSSFYKCSLKIFAPSAHYMLNDGHDQKMIDQFKDYDIGIETQIPERNARTSNGVKIFMYAGLPVISHFSLNNTNIWFNNSNEETFFVKKPDDWLKHLNFLKNPSIRQNISEKNKNISINNAGIINSAKSFMEAIEKYESNN